MRLSRSHMCGDLRAGDAGATVTIAGWVNTFRSQGKGLVFIDVRDRSGMTQVVFDEDDSGSELTTQGDQLRREDVIAITGAVRKRESANPNLPTGEIEIVATDLEVLNKTDKPPILPDEHEAGKIAEERRLEYRYIDLRRPRMQHILAVRHQAMKIARDYFASNGFVEIETPFLIKSTPEGARDFIVPSRMYPGKWYALPQSPQIFKQILMVAGCDRYLQIVRCFRDEDPRADRQAEFSQIDLEMSFVSREDVMQMMQGYARRLWKEVKDIDIGEVPVMSYRDAMERYGIDRPDLRFGLELTDISDIAAKTDFRVFKNALEQKTGCVKAIVVPAAADSITRKMTDAYNDFVKDYGAGGVPTVKLTEEGFQTGIAKFLEPVQDEVIERLDLKPGDIVFFSADAWPVACAALGNLRNRVAKDLDLIPDDAWKFLWVIDFPMFEWNEDEGRFDALHHPFTSPMPDQFDLLESDPGNCISAAYDLVVNGSEIAGGSIRIHQPHVQQKVFDLLGITEDEAEIKFGFLLKALRYGAPPMGGIAFGLDRLIMHLVGTENIREVIAFPKTMSGVDLMTEAPGPVDPGQLDELGIRVQTEQEAAHAIE